jgi:putative spermidine/putrescine transport system permease protein
VARPSAGRLGLGLVVGVTALALLAPILVVFPLSFTSQPSFIFPPNGYSTRWYQTFFTDPEWVYALYDSILVAVATAVLATIIGTAACFGMRRLGTKIQLLIVGLLLLPVVVPIVITGVGIYAVFLEWDLVGTYQGFVLAHTLYALPLVVVPVMASMSTFDRTLELAAGSLGASKWSTFRQVTLPSIMPGVAAGAVFAFVQSWDEIVISIFISTPSLTTLPVRMYNAVAADVDPTLAAASSLVITIVTLSIFLTFFVSPSRRRSNAAAAS